MESASVEFHEYMQLGVGKKLFDPTEHSVPVVQFVTLSRYIMVT